MGYILNFSNKEKPSIYLNTSFMNFNNVKTILIENPKVSRIEQSNPDDLEDWTKTLELILMGEDQDTSFIPLDLSDYTPKQARVIDVVHKKIPVNEYLSYSEVADIAGFPNAQRFVGSTMKICRQYPIIPCKRVKNSQWIKRFRGKNQSNRRTRTPRSPL